MYAYLDFKNRVHMKGRIPKDEKEIPPFRFTDVITRDTKQILSCETVNVGDLYVVHLELQPGCKNNILNVLLAAESRCRKYLGETLASKVVYRIHTNEEGFITTHSGKRDLKYLTDEGIEKAIKPIILDDTVSFVDATNYVDIEKAKKYVKE